MRNKELDFALLASQDWLWQLHDLWVGAGFIRYINNGAFEIEITGSSWRLQTLASMNLRAAGCSPCCSCKNAVLDVILSETMAEFFMFSLWDNDSLRSDFS